MGNLGSIQNMFKRIKVESEITGDLEKIAAAEKIVLPGVGAFDAAMEKINAAGLRTILDKKTLVEKIPVLGICLGMQLLTESSQEGILPGLGWLDAKTIKFNLPDISLKVPHMGWNLIYNLNKSLLTIDLPDDSRFYFVHSFHVQSNVPDDVLATTYYGEHFHSIVQHENIYGAQFHPEKSHKFGMKFLENFARL